MAKVSRQRHAPLRTCVACGNKTSPRELIRLVAAQDGAVQVDALAKHPGRGAYLCRDLNCVRNRLKRGRLEYSLRMGISDDAWNSLAPAIESIIAQGHRGTLD